MSTSTDVNTKTRKRRPKETGILVGVRLQSDLLRLLDDFRRSNKDLPNRPEAIRRILESALRKPTEPV